MDAAQSSPSTKPSVPTSRPGLFGVIIDFAMAGVMFLLFFAVILPPHIPVNDPIWNAIWAAYTATVMAGFFWLFFTLFRATITDQLSRRELGNSKAAKLARLMRYA